MTTRDESQYNDPLLFLADNDNDDIDLFKEAVAQIGIRSDLYIHNNGQQLLDTLRIIAPLAPGTGHYISGYQYAGKKWFRDIGRDPDVLFRQNSCFLSFHCTR